MKIALGLACFAVAVTIVVADSPTYTSGDYFDAPWDKKTIKNKAGENVRPMQCTNGGNSGYIKEECGLPGLPGYVLGCCVYMGPLADIDNYGKCDLASSGGYRTWCDECYDFPGETFMGQPLGVTYTGVPGDPSKIVMGESATPGEATCEFGTCPSPGVPAGSCWTSANPKTDCLRNIPYDFDFKVDGKSDGVVDYCCDLVPESYVHVEDPTINDCFTYDVNPDTGCIVESSIKFNDGATCYPDPTNKCDRGTCQTLANGDRTCDSAPVVCNDSNDCTTDGVCDRSDGCPDPQPKDDNVPCQSTEPCFGNGVCKSGACADAAPTECPSGATCDPEQNACVETQNADLAPLFAAAAGGLCCFGAAAAILVKKRNDAMEEAKRDSIMTQKTDNYGRADMGMKNKHMSTMTGVSRMTRGGGSGGDKYEATSHFTRNSDGVSQKSRASRTSRSSAGRNSVGRGSTGRSSGSRKGDYDFKSSGTRSTVGGSSHGGRSSRSSKSRNSNGTRRTSGSRNSQSRGSRSSRGRY